MSRSWCWPYSQVFLFLVCYFTAENNFSQTTCQKSKRVVLDLNKPSFRHSLSSYFSRFRCKTDLKELFLPQWCLFTLHLFIFFTFLEEMNIAKGLVKKYRGRGGGGPEHLEMWLIKNTWPTPWDCVFRHVCIQRHKIQGKIYPWCKDTFKTNGKLLAPAHISPRVTLQMLKKNLSKEKP